MTEFMIFIWVIGWMISIGLSTDIGRDDSEIPISWSVIYWIMAFFIWPVYLGIHMKEN